VLNWREKIFAGEINYMNDFLTLVNWHPGSLLFNQDNQDISEKNGTMLHNEKKLS
jgi:hypothetical protein